MPLTAADLRRLREIINRHWTALVIRVYGPEAIAADAREVAALVADGILDPAAVAALDPAQDAYVFGFLRDKLHDAGLDPLVASFAEVEAVLASSPATLSVASRAAVQLARQTAGLHAQGLGNRMADALLSDINVEDAALRTSMLDVIQDEVAKNRLLNETVGKLAGRLAERTGDYARDWRRLAATETMNVEEHGIADVVEADFGKDARVAKIPNDDACKSCVAAYLDERGRPRIYSMSTLRANGSNVGRKARDYLPTVDPLHPWCHCRMISVPHGFAFNKEWQLVPAAKAE